LVGLGGTAVPWSTLGVKVGHLRRSSARDSEGESELTITLTDSQVAQIVGRAAGVVGLNQMLAPVDGEATIRRLLDAAEDVDSYSRSTLRALMVLAAFPDDGTSREITEVARQLGLSPSTTHRYVGTWVAIGVLVQQPRTRTYRRALVSVGARSR
jgi:hypothetical protein